ncbi:hypothetical protein ACS0TY_032468 [Phlomoides rotata]
MAADWQWENAAAGSAVGAFATVTFTQPLDVVRTRLQVNDGRLSNLPSYKNPLHALTTISHTEVLKKADMIRKNAVESILAERDILISVRNPFVVRFFYSFTCRENLYLVMEYLNGGDLYSLLRNLGCLDEDVARVYIAEVDRREYN